jgi:hypothetical protein
VIESICAKGSDDIPPVIIVEGKYHMKSWYKDGLKRGEKVLLSESGFTNDELIMAYLDHFIQYSKAGPTKAWKLLLCDSGGGHRTPQFAHKAYENHIIVVWFPPHLTRLTTS